MICTFEVADDLPIASRSARTVHPRRLGRAAERGRQRNFGGAHPRLASAARRAGRTRICRRASIMSDFPTVRWAIPRSAIPISAPDGSSCRTCRGSTPRSPSGKLAAMPALRDFIGKLKESRGTAHVIGLLSPGGVHSHQHQIAALARILSEAGLPVAVHAILDGRDTPPKAAASYLKIFQRDVAGLRASSDRDPVRSLLCDGSR